MGKYRKVSEELEQIFSDVLAETSIPQWVEFQILANDKQKELIKVSKVSDWVEFLNNLNILITVNEEIFDQLTEEFKKISISECLAGIVVNENDIVSVEKPNFTTYTGVLTKFGDEKIIRFKESVISLFDDKKKRDDDKKVSKMKK